MKKVISLLFCCLAPTLHAQLSLEECQQRAQENYPLVRQYELIEKTKEYTLSNLSKGNLPQISLSGKASYQSDVTSLPFDFPGVPNELLPKDQYQAVVEVQQNIWDGGNIRAKKQEAEARSDEQHGQLQVNMYALRERVNQLYFGILLLDEQLKQNRLLQEQLARSLEQVTAYCANGIAHEADMDAVKVEQIKSRQQAIALENNRAAYRRMLALFVGTSADSLHVVKPTSETNSSSDIRRPELDWYQAQEQRIAIQEQNLKAAYMPRFSLFAQGGYANPGLNMLKDDFQAYYVVGARLSWNFGSLYTLKNDRRKLDAERRMVQSNAETFLFNTRLQLTEKDAAIESLRKQMQEDDEMIRLQSNIRRAAEVKTANGTLSVIDMLQEINKESQARQNKVLHEVQLLLDIYQRKYLTNQ